MKNYNKRWLLSIMKTSGSRRRDVYNGNYSDERNNKKYKDIENLPNHESIGKGWKHRGILNYGLLVRFLNGQVGKNWDDVYSEVKSRIPTKLNEYQYILFKFVAINTEIVNGFPYNKQNNKFIWTKEQGDFNFEFDNSKFYVCPITKRMLKVEDKPSKRITKNMEKKELRKFRELNKQELRKFREMKKYKNIIQIEDLKKD